MATVRQDYPGDALRILDDWLDPDVLRAALQAVMRSAQTMQNAGGSAFADGAANAAGQLAVTACRALQKGTIGWAG